MGGPRIREEKYGKGEPKLREAGKNKQGGGESWEEQDEEEEEEDGWAWGLGG